MGIKHYGLPQIRAGNTKTFYTDMSNEIDVTWDIYDETGIQPSYIQKNDEISTRLQLKCDFNAEHIGKTFAIRLSDKNNNLIDELLIEVISLI